MTRIIYALRVHEDNAADVLDSLKSGEGRFGWSYVKTADLRSLQRRIEQGDDLTPEEQDCYQEFLLDLDCDDYVVYVNVPTYGECTLARVTGAYYWKWADSDFNHRFPVDPTSVRTFDRNDKAVHPRLRSRLKLQGRKWRIYAEKEFAALVTALGAGAPKGEHYSPASDKGHLQVSLSEMFADVTRRVQETHPNTALEHLVQEALRAVPGVVDVARKAGPKERGADLLVTFEDGLPLGGLGGQRTCVVQVKSYEGTHGCTAAVEQIKTALEFHGADMGLIISSASEKSRELERALGEAQKETGKPIGLVIGADFARFVLKYAADVLGQDDLA